VHRYLSARLETISLGAFGLEGDQPHLSAPASADFSPEVGLASGLVGDLRPGGARLQPGAAAADTKRMPAWLLLLVVALLMRMLVV
jgi:hypothetical protein